MTSMEWISGVRWASSLFLIMIFPDRLRVVGLIIIIVIAIVAFADADVGQHVLGIGDGHASALISRRIMSQT
jgi:hypothetical protein